MPHVHAEPYLPRVRSVSDPDLASKRTKQKLLREPLGTSKVSVNAEDTACSGQTSKGQFPRGRPLRSGKLQSIPSWGQRKSS